MQRAMRLDGGSRIALEVMLRYLVVGLGFGIKKVFSNFVSGLWLLFEGSVRPGDVLMVEGDPCEVRRLGLRATLLWRSRDNAELLIPNQRFFTEATTTFTASDRMRRSEVRVTAVTRHDPGQVIALLEATAAAVPQVLASPPPRAFLAGFGDGALNYNLRFWIANPMQNASTCSAVNRAIWQAFEWEGIEIPSPQKVQHSFSRESP